MMAWLNDWIKQILTVLLLAAVVDLLVPGKAYERYTRLALGLIILAAMLGPVLKLFREDPERLIERSLAGWSVAADRSSARMPGLEAIRSEAEALRGRQERQAAELAAEALEASIREAVNRLNGPRARDVRVELAEGRGGPEIASVSIVLEAARDRETEDEPGGGHVPAAGSEDGTVRPIRIGPIDPVKPVEAVRIRSGTERAVPASGPAAGRAGAGGGAPDADGRKADGPAADGLAAAPEGIAAVIRAVVHQGWGVEPERIAVWMPA
ncbi:MAG: stage III sporulation protein AF [Thermobacillus sp. ZCTH02-B1]|uniref:stage III sporulation protein AF n=1 Tax=Thermobacillus sp. ZCTH02-B1 TaxID=1858795 RepID=UPI000B5603F8|nr:stage III sporulation protein AF [Thermobacillus sp. ZCTH02-B1]OUM96872.1 MAG: stage III sporulation protein AF [Thermobacillus sp. ZCTH02-B1]